MHIENNWAADGGTAAVVWLSHALQTATPAQQAIDPPTGLPAAVATAKKPLATVTRAACVQMQQHWLIAPYGKTETKLCLHCVSVAAAATHHSSGSTLTVCGVRSCCLSPCCS